MSKNMIRNQQGVALIEFAIILPFLLIVFLGLIEVANYTLHHQKADKLAHAMADFTAQGDTISASELDSFRFAIAPIMSPLDFRGSVIITSAGRYNPIPTGTPCTRRNRPCITWQYRVSGGAASAIGAPGSAPSIPGNYRLQRNNNIIIAEAYVEYKPVLSISSQFLGAFTPETIYKTALYVPRQGSLATLSP